jgi:DHA1 family tetracycline resistance protein-like MFS transporter
LGTGSVGGSKIRRVLLSQSVINTASSIVSNPVLPLYYRSIGASMGELGLITTMSFVGYALFEPTLGFLSDRIGRRRIIFVATFLQALVILAFTINRNVSWFYLVSFLNSACSAGIMTPTRALIADITPKDRRGRSYGAFLTMQSVGRVFGPAVGGYIVYGFGYNYAFYVSAVLMMGSAVSVPFFYPEDDDANHLEKDFSLSGLRTLLTRRTMIFIASRALPFFFMFYATILTVMLKESPQFEATEATLGLMTTSISIVSVGAQYMAGHFLDRIGSVNLIVLGFILDGFGYFGYVLASSLPEIWAVRLLIGAISPMYNVGMMVAMMELAPSQSYGLMMGLYGLSEDIGGMVGSPTLGWVYASYGFEATTYFMSFICFFAAGIIGLNMRGHETKQAPKLASGT